MPTTSRKTYSEMVRFNDFNSRFEYLDLHGKVGELTHGDYRYLNQKFYTSREWRLFRNAIIERDNGCDLGVPDHEIRGKIYVHHIVPITVEMLMQGDPLLLDPNNAVCVSRQTHDAIHYGSIDTAPQEYTPRRPGDTTPWKRGSNEQPNRL